MRTVIVESPFAGRVEANKVYARLAIRDCLKRGEAPFASHLLYTLDSVLDDTDPAERAGRTVEYRSLLMEADEIADVRIDK